jgi:hypothetical protein
MELLVEDYKQNFAEASLSERRGNEGEAATYNRNS